MTTQDHIKRARWSLDSIEAKIGSNEAGVLKVALVDALRLAESCSEIIVAVARRVGK